jgi:hypothetical protein
MKDLKEVSHLLGCEINRKSLHWSYLYAPTSVHQGHHCQVLSRD